MIRHGERSWALLASLALVAALGGCGFIGASGVSHAKPDTFILRGHVAVPVPVDDRRPDGAACAATVPDIVGGTSVMVNGPDGHLLATGKLGDGVIGHTGTASSCDFPFQIAAVPGGVTSYDITIGTHTQRFPAKDLRENAVAILTVTGK
jgi:hypothetical protein